MLSHLLLWTFHGGTLIITFSLPWTMLAHSWTLPLHFQDSLTHSYTVGYFLLDNSFWISPGFSLNWPASDTYVFRLSVYIYADSLIVYTIDLSLFFPKIFQRFFHCDGNMLPTPKPWGHVCRPTSLCKLPPHPPHSFPSSVSHTANYGSGSFYLVLSSLWGMGPLLFSSLILSSVCMWKARYCRC